MSLFASALHKYPVTPLACTILLSTAYSLPVTAQGAGALTPGGVQPQLQKESKPSPSAVPEYEVPALIERPIGIDEGPTIVVSSFILNGAEDIPEAGISVTELEKLLEQQRKARPEGFTIGQLQEAANSITQYYRKQGLILGQAFIPAQDIKNGEVIISVLPGILGQIGTENNKSYNAIIMQRPFTELVDKPVQLEQVESALLRMDDLPGLDAFGIFRPGKNVGETELLLNVKEEKPFEFLVLADNHGVQTTGEYRLLGNIAWNNPTGNGDELNITALQTFDPEDSLYGAIYYEIPLENIAYSVGFSYSTNTYEVNQITTNFIDGDTTIGSIFGKYRFIRSRDLNAYAELSFSSKAADVNVLGIDSEDDLSVFALEVGFDNIDTHYRGINKGSLSYSQGLTEFAGSMGKAGDSNAIRRNQNGDPIGGDFTKFDFSLSRLQFLNDNQSLLLRLSGQHSDDLLSSLEQFSLGGPNSVRAYTVSEYVSDKGFFTSLEWLLDAPGFADKPAFDGRTWGEIFTLSLYAEYALGKLNYAPELSAEGEKVELSGAGIGLEIRLQNQFFLRLDIAKPLGNLDAADDDDPQLWFSTGFEF
jgi:hemolysin activation/secretion protein